MSRIELGRRPPTETIAAALDKVRPGKQTERYARALIATAGADRDTANARLLGRMERQRRFWERWPAVRAVFIVDEVALYRFVGSTEVVAEQCRHLAEVAELPNVVLQVMPLTFSSAAWEQFLGEIRWPTACRFRLPG